MQPALKTTGLGYLMFGGWERGENDCHLLRFNFQPFTFKITFPVYNLQGHHCHFSEKYISKWHAIKYSHEPIEAPLELTN